MLGQELERARHRRRDRATDELDQLVGRPAAVEKRQEPGQEHLSCRSGEPDDGSGVLEQNRILERCEPVPRFQERPLRDGEGDHRSGAERHARAAGAAAAADVDVEREERVARSSGLRGELEQLCGQSVEHALVLSHRGLPGRGLPGRGLRGAVCGRPVSSSMPIGTGPFVAALQQICVESPHVRISRTNESNYVGWYPRAVTAPAGFDVLVIGSGASGLAAAVSAERAGARTALATKGSIQACNSAKAQGGIQASFGDDDSPEQHATDIWKSSHETADMRLVEALTGDAQSAIHWLEELGVAFTRAERRLPPRPLRRRLREAPAPGRRPDRPRDHEGAPRGLRGRRRDALRQQSSRTRSSPRRTAGAPAAASTSSTRRPSCSRPAVAVSRSRRSAASSRRTIRTRPAR